MQRRPLLLVIDDEVEITRMLKGTLEDEGFAVETLSDGSKVVSAVGAIMPDLILLDIFMPNHDGLDLLEQIRMLCPNQKVIMISGFGTIPIVLDAMKKGAMDFIEKPINLDDLLSKLSFLKNYNNPLSSHEKNHENFNCPLVGSSALFCEFLRTVHLLVPSTGPLIIYGPEGCGKASIARYIHDQRYGQENTNFVTFDCSLKKLENIPTIPQSGTVFFKNVNHLDDDGQKILLAFIDENPNERLIASSSPNLYSLVEKGLFSKMLFCRLNALSVELASINKRRYDIPLIIDAFLMQANAAFVKKCSISSEALRLLRNYAWAGDVAQIKSVVFRFVETCDTSDQVIGEDRVKVLLPECPQFFVSEQLYLRFNSLEQATEAFQQHYLTHLLKMYQYDLNQIANFLQIPVAQLHNKMIKLRIGTEKV